MDFETVTILRASGILLLTGLHQEEPLGCFPSIEYAISMTLGILAVLAVTSIVLFMVGAYLSKTPLLRRIALSTIQASRQGYTARTYPDSLIGIQGIAQTPLRPAGKITIQNVYYDAKTPGTYVAPGVTVVVTGVEGNSLMVQAIHQV